MKWIAHRGNISGPNPELENKPEYIQKALDLGFDVEIDVWQQPDGLYLGHDKSTYKTNRYFLQNQRLWVHCKNSDAFINLSKFTNINCFLQEEDEIALTTRGFLWAHSKCKSWNDKTVVVNLGPQLQNPDIAPFAVCSDYVQLYSSITQNDLPFDLLILDIDGVMTDGTKIYDRDGKVVGKNYCDLDFTAIKRFLAAGIKVCFLSGDETVNKAMAETRKITFYHNSPGIDKVDYLSAIKFAYNAKRVAYVGDDYYDLGIMNVVDFAFCPKTSPSIIRKNAIVIDIPAGKGVIAGLYDKFENQIMYAFPVDSKDVNPK